MLRKKLLRFKNLRFFRLARLLCCSSVWEWLCLHWFPAFTQKSRSMGNKNCLKKQSTIRSIDTKIMPLINTYKYRFKESYAPETVVRKLIWNGLTIRVNEDLDIRKFTYLHCGGKMKLEDPRKILGCLFGFICLFDLFGCLFVPN